MSKTHLHDNEVILDVKNLRVAYGKVEALHEVSLTIRRGEIVTVIGPNGAGKTTLLSALMGPMTVTISPRRMVRLTSCNASTLP